MSAELNKLSLKQYLAVTRDTFPEVNIVRKSDSRFMRFLGSLLFVLSFGKNKEFMRSFTTTIGDTIYVGTDWDILPVEEQYSIIRHECVHLEQQKKYGKLLFAFLYLFFPVPVVFAYWRTKFEKEAYEVQMRVNAQQYGVYLLSTVEYRRFICSQFTSASYLWMWPFERSIQAWYDSTVKVITKELEGA